jgi:hypothetical protein
MITTAEQVEGQPVTYLLSRISVQPCTCYVSDYSQIKAIFFMEVSLGGGFKLNFIYLKNRERRYHFMDWSSLI